MFLPPHEYVFPLSAVPNGDGALSCLFLEGTESRELGPMAQVHLTVRPPVVMFGKEAVLGSDDLAFKVRCEGRMVFGESCMGR